jgi:hypothetical protein
MRRAMVALTPGNESICGGGDVEIEAAANVSSAIG